MPKYTIQILYHTGDSFGSEDREENLELTWEDLSVVKDNLRRIQEHYKMYQDINSFLRKPTRKQSLEENRNKDWFVTGDDDYAEYCLYLKTDNGKNVQLATFWCGYFETLYGAEVVILGDPEMRFRV